MVLNSVSSSDRSRARRCTTVCKPSVSSRPSRPSTLSRKLDFALAMSEPITTFEIPIGDQRGESGDSKCKRVTMLPVDLVHVFLEIHAVPARDDGRRRGKNCDERERLDNFAGAIRRHAQINLQDCRERVSVTLRQFGNLEQSVIN